MRLLSTSLVVAAMFSLAACETATIPHSSTASPVAAANYSQLMDDLRILSADDMQGRDTGSEGGAKARQYIVDRFEALGIAPSSMGRLQPWEAQGRSPEGQKTYNGVNILGLIPGSRVSDKYIVVTAHYDHVGIHDGYVFNGADDNASGVATMLELASRLKETPPEHSVLIVALDGEERGLLGAKEFVEAPPFPLSSIVMNINYDMTARANVDGYLWVTGTYQHPYFRTLLDSLEPNGSIRLNFGKDTPNDTGADNWVFSSDHGAFHRANVPFLYFGVNFHEDYHKPSDDYERVSPAAFQSATELAIASFHRLDKGLSR